jgi:hypothetical protein
LKGRDFDTIEVIVTIAGGTVTLTEHKFQEAIKVAEAMGTVQIRGRVLF